MKRIAFFQSDLGTGGIQKSIINLLRNLDYDRFAVDLYLSQEDTARGIDFPDKLNIQYLKPIPRLYSFIPFEAAKKRINYDFHGCEEYDLAVDFNSYQVSCAAGALSVPAKRRVMWIHNDVEIKLQNEWKYRVLWHFFKGKFPYYDAFVGVSGALIEPFKRASGLADKPYRVIENYIDVAEIREKMKAEPEHFSVDDSCLNLVAVGRLCHQKGYDIMLNVFREACRQREDLRLYIIGGGSDGEELEKQAAELGLTEKVTFLGEQKNPFCYMKKMDAFISTSRYEGQPLNIMEAMAVGLPLYCTKNLEKYTEGLTGYEDLVAALAVAGKAEKRPDDLAAYNGRIIDAIEDLAGGH